MPRKFPAVPDNQINSHQDPVANYRLKTTVLSVACITLAVVVCGLLVVNAIIAGYPKSVGYVIEITPEGKASYIPDAVKVIDEWDPNVNTKNYFLREFITQLRSVSSDPQIVDANINKLYKRVTDQAAKKASEYIETTKPKSRLKKETVTIMISSILPLSESTYQIDWRETVWSSGRSLISDQHYRCIAHTQIYLPRTEEQAAFNPWGLYITDYEITIVKEI